MSNDLISGVNYFTPTCILESIFWIEELPATRIMEVYVETINKILTTEEVPNPVFTCFFSKTYSDVHSEALPSNATSSQLTERILNFLIKYGYVCNFDYNKIVSNNTKAVNGPQESVHVVMRKAPILVNGNFNVLEFVTILRNASTQAIDMLSEREKVNLYILSPSSQLIHVKKYHTTEVNQNDTQRV